jgi:hypothetical protein
MVPYQTLLVTNIADHVKGSHSSFGQLTQHFTVYLRSVSLCKKGIMYFTLKTSEIDDSEFQQQELLANSTLL